MPTARPRPPTPPTMLSPGRLLLSKTLLGAANVRFASASRLFSWEATGRLSSFHRHSSQEAVNGCGDEAAVPPLGADPAEARWAWTVRDSMGDEGEGAWMKKNNDNPSLKIGKLEAEAGTQESKSRAGHSNSGSPLAWAPIIRKKPGKAKVSWVCDNCGATPGQWWGTCPSCQAVNTVKKFSEFEPAGSTGFQVSEAAARSWLHQGPGMPVPQSLEEVKKGMNQQEWRIPLPGAFGMEVARVLGGGLVPGSLVLFGGDPGIGKSTLLLQIAACLAEGLGSDGPAQVLYVSGEESMDQIGNRADRMQIQAPGLYLYSSTDIERIMYSASMTIADMRDSNKIKRIKLQLLVESLKLSSILRGQVAYLEEWSFMEEEHSSSLSGAIEALRGCILRLPVVAGARADIQDVKDAVGSAVDVMQAMGSSISAILSKVKRTCSLVGELAKVAAQEQALLDQSRDLLCAAAAMHVKQCSLRGHLLQLRHTAA